MKKTKIRRWAIGVACLIILALLSLALTSCTKDECANSYANPDISYDHTDAEGWVHITVANWEVFPNELFRPAPELPPCGANANSSRTWVEIYNADDDTRIYGFCALDSNENLQLIWFSPDTPTGRAYVVINDRACSKSYQSNVISYGECADTYANPEISYDHTDAEGLVHITVANWDAFPNELFRPAPELPPCGANTNSSRTWVNIYNADDDTGIYGFCGLDSNENLQLIWFSPDTPTGRAYVVINDRACSKSYQSNVISYGECADTYANPEISYDHTDAEGLVHITVANWDAFPNELFRPAPELPPCGANTNSSRTWVDIYNADDDTRIYGYCALDSNENLQLIWFSPNTPTGRVYAVINDRACGISYKSNVISYP
jgi:hypothetical protein